MDLSDDEKDILKSFNLLSFKPVIYVTNVSEDDLLDDGNSNPHVAKIRVLQTEDAEVIVVSAQIEEEIAQLEPDEKRNFLRIWV